MKYFTELNPLYWSIISWTLTLTGFGAGEILFRNFGLDRENPGLIIPILVIIAAIAPFSVLVILALSYKRNAESLGRIVSLYLSLILICANINFIIMAHFSHGDTPPFHGIHPLWSGEDFKLHWNDAFLTVVDCLHFSVTTLSTVGYGDIYPTAWFSKLIVDAEALTGLGITILIVGRYFSRYSDKK